MLAALIPMKELALAKMRLAEALDRGARADLALAMLTDVITACHESDLFDSIHVVSSDSDVRWHAHDLGAAPIAEPRTLAGLNDAIAFGQRYLVSRTRVDELLILPADIPLIRADDLRTVVHALNAVAGARAVIVRAFDGGTNALALRPPESVAPRFGQHSADGHAAAALAADIGFEELTIERISFDVDEPADLEALAGLPLGAATAGWVEARAYIAVQPTG